MPRGVFQVPSTERRQDDIFCRSNKGQAADCRTGLVVADISRMAPANIEQIDDVRAAISWAFDPAGDAALGVELVVAALPLWQELSAFREMLEAIDLAGSSSAALMGALAPLGRAKLPARAWAMTLAPHATHKPMIAARKHLSCEQVARRRRF